MIYFGFTWRLKREENISSEIVAPTEIYIGSSRFGIIWLDFDWGRCGGMMGDFCILILAILLLKSDYFVPIDVYN